MGSFNIREISSRDRRWIEGLLEDRWGSCVIVSRGRIHHADGLSGFVAVEEGENLGLVTYALSGTECEVVTLDSVREGRGVASALLRAVESAARQAGCSRLWLVTTNDNLKALRFYQKRGFVLVALHRNAVEMSRRQKPEIPRTGSDGIPIRDELELEMTL